MNAIQSSMILDAVLNPRADIGRPKPTGLCRAIVSRILDSGEIVVRIPGSPEISFTCDAMITGGHSVIEVNDPVLVLAPSTSDERGVVLGLLGPYIPAPMKASEPVEHLAMEASESLSLKCGESSIEMRKDGKVLVKGKDIVSHAKRVQRIKGGSVAIN